MKFSAAILFMGLLAGCSSIQQITYSDIPQLLIRSPLPDISYEMYLTKFSLNILLLIDKSGNVEIVRLLNTSGNTLWDSLAVISIMNWKYSPARIKGEPVPAWVRQKALIKYSDPVYMELEEILCNNIQLADSVYNALSEGKKFDVLAKDKSVSPSSKNDGNIGIVNINQYPDEIRKTILELRISEFTRPMKFGSQFLIIKRLKSQ